MSDADCTPGREPRSVAASLQNILCKQDNHFALQENIIYTYPSLNFDYRCNQY